MTRAVLLLTLMVGSTSAAAQTPAAPATPSIPAPPAAPAPSVPAATPAPVITAQPVPVPMPDSHEAIGVPFPDSLEELEGPVLPALDLAFDFDPGHIRFALSQARPQIAQAQREAIAEAERAIVRARDAMGRANDAYTMGLNALQARQYERAIEAFDRVLSSGGSRHDAALYWKAFSEFKLARTEAALGTLNRLQKEHAGSRYGTEAKVLEAEARKQTGQVLDPQQLDDDEMKLLAIQGLQRTDQAIPLLEGVLAGANSLNVKKRALYVLGISSDSRARDILIRQARGGGNPDLQLEAVRLLVSRRDQQTTGAVLREIYESTTDAAVRRAVLDAYRVRSTGRSGAAVPVTSTAAQDLPALYQIETDLDLRRQILGLLVGHGAIDPVLTLIRSERDPQGRARLIQALSATNTPRATQALLELYGSLPDQPAREAVVGALAAQRNVDALIGLARAETHVPLKTRIVGHLAAMAGESKAAADYLMEVIR
jgi:tetratricopeptide (TPR) repeat protein